MDERRSTLRPRLKTAVLVGIPLMPFFLACLGTTAVPQSRGLSDHKILPPLAFRQYAVNLHEVAPTATLTAPFAFWNRSGKPLKIVKLEPSCGCLTPRLLGNRSEYGPGGQGLFEVQVETAREPAGPHTYSIRVHYSVDEQPYEELVTFRCEIPERNVTVTPPELYFYQLSDAPLESQLRVEDHRGKQLKITEASSRSPYLTVQVGPQEKHPEGRSSTTLQVGVKPGIPAGSNHTFIAIKTDDPDFPLIRVPVFLQGRPAKVQLSSGSSPARPVDQQTQPADKTHTPSKPGERP